MLNQQMKVFMEEREAGFSKLFEALDFWEHHIILTAKLRINDKVQEIEYTFAPQSFINYLWRGEKFGVSFGEMIFISSEVQRQRPKWIPYIVLKLYAEKYVDPGLDESGRVQHFESLFRTIRLAGAELSETELAELLIRIAENETTGYFKFDKEVRKFLEEFAVSGKSKMLQEKRAYLENHHGNRWVRQGRTEESLAEFGIDFGFRNRAEAIAEKLFDPKLASIYLISFFIHSLMAIEPGEEIFISPPFNSIAYMLTKNGNNIVDLVKFVGFDPQNPQQDIIVLLPGKNRTWTALAKRLSYFIHRGEIQARQLIATKKTELDQIMIEAGSLNSRVHTELAIIKERISEDKFEDTKEVLKKLSGNWVKEIEGVANISRQIAENIAMIDQISNLLEEAI